MSSVFTAIINRELPAEILYEDSRLIAVCDIAPQAPFHALVITKHPWKDVLEAASAEPDILAAMVAVAQQLTAEKYGGQFRLVFNVGSAAGQTVFHLHAHVLAGLSAEQLTAESKIG